MICAGLTSAIIMMPSNFLIMTIFKNIRPRYKRNLYHVHLDTLRMHMALRAIADEDIHQQSFVTGFASEYFTSEPVDELPSYKVLVSDDVPPEVEAQEKALRESAKKRFSAHQDLECKLPWWVVYFNWVRKT
jgi:hypothetical protein